MSASKRDILVSEALKLFYRNGFHATGMDLVASEVGISKTSIYKHFRTKEDLFQAVLRLRDESFRNWLFRYAEEAGSAPRKQLLSLFDAHQEWFLQKGFQGCMFIKATAEYQDPKDPIHETAAEHKRLIRRFIMEKVELMGAKNPDQLSDQLFMLMEGSIVMATILGPGKIIDGSKRAAKVLMDDALK